MNRLFPLLFVATIFMGGLTGCSFLESKDQAATVESVGEIKGQVTNTGGQHGPIIVVAMQKEKGAVVKINKQIANEDGSYKFVLLPGNYLMAAYVDKNNNNRYDADEHGKSDFNAPTVKVISKKSVTFTPIVISGFPKALPAKSQVTAIQSKAMKNIGKVVKFDDPMFNQDNYSEGMWRPLDFLEKTGGGLFFLEPYSKSKTPVLFVHGINGGPTDFEKLIASLDRKKYQPWIIYYSTGLRLDMVSDYLTKAMSDLQNKYHFKEFIVVAHSMGGLVSRSFVKKYYERHPKKAKGIKRFITVNSPLGGIGALSSIKSIPLIIAVWLDLAPDSQFLKGIHSWQLPKTTKYYMFFSYLEGEDSDGVVAIHSQLPYNVQKEAVRLYGFNTNHVGPLKEDKFIKIIKKTIQQGNGR